MEPGATKHSCKTDVHEANDKQWFHRPRLLREKDLEMRLPEAIPAVDKTRLRLLYDCKVPIFDVSPLKSGLFQGILLVF